MQEVAVKRVAKNTIIMFIRMVVLMAIGFLASRWLLRQLGVEDYGIYSVVGSVTSTFVALKSLFSESIQRFLNFYKGKGDIPTQAKVFSISILIHIILAIMFVLVLECAGMWLINNKLVFPLEKYNTIVFVFQMTVISSVFSILCIPFDAIIIANERMGFFAFVSILDAIFRLLVVLALPYISIESLRAYSLLLVFIPVSSLIISGFYSKRFSECRFLKPSDPKLLKEIVSLSGWNFFGNISFSLLHEGINFILNIFGGLVSNAARAIAYQVKGIAVQFSNNSLIAARPMVMQSAAYGAENESLFNNIIEVSRISFFIMLLPIIPLVIYCEELLQVWLVEVPENSVLYTRLVLAAVLIRSLHEPLNMLYMSLGKIKRMMIIETFIMLATLIIVYLSLYIGAPTWQSFFLLAIMEIIIVITLVLNAKKEFIFPVRMYVTQVLQPTSFLFLLFMIISFFFSLVSPPNMIILLLLCLAVVMVTIVMVYLFMNAREKKLINDLILSKMGVRFKI